MTKAAITGTGQHIYLTIDSNNYYFYTYDTLPPCSFGITYFELFYNGLLSYAFWQFSYLAITEVFHAGFLNREAGYQTSLRWLAVDTRNSMNRLSASHNVM